MFQFGSIYWVIPSGFTWQRRRTLSTLTTIDLQWHRLKERWLSCLEKLSCMGFPVRRQIAEQYGTVPRFGSACLILVSLYNAGTNPFECYVRWLKVAEKTPFTSTCMLCLPPKDLMSWDHWGKLHDRIGNSQHIPNSAPGQQTGD